MTPARVIVFLAMGLAAAFCANSRCQAQATSFLFSRYDGSGVENPLDEIIQWWPAGPSVLLHQTVSNDVDWNPAEGHADAWFAQHFADEIGYFTPGTGTGFTDSFHLSVNYPKHLTLFDDHVYVSARNVGRVLKYDYTGNLVDSVDTGYTFGGQGMATDGSHLYVSSWTGSESTFEKYDADLNLVDSFANPTGVGALVNIFDFAYDALSGNFVGLAADFELGTQTRSDTLLEFGMGGSVAREYLLSFEADGIGQAPLTSMPGDGNGDGVVNGLDYLLWASRFGDDPAADPPGSPGNGDYNNDGIVSGLDYLVWASNFGAGSATVAVPEPGTCMLLIMGIAMLITRRRRW